MQKNVPLSEDILSLGWGYIDETYNPGIIAELVNKAISKRGYEVLQYNDCLGLTELRKYGKQFLEEKFGVQNIEDDEIIITNGATAGIDLASRYILEQGTYNSIALSPVYDTALESLKRNSKNVISIPLNLFDKEDKDILDWKQLEEAMQEDNTKLIYVNPNFQNPAGIVFNQETKVNIYRLAEKYGVTILEDDPYKVYNFSNSELGENIINMDEKKNNVIYLNSISKVFYPGLRIGFLVGNSEVVKGISELQKYSTSSPNLIMQGAVIEAFKNGELDKSLSHYMKEIGEKSDIIISALGENGLLRKDSPIEFTESEGGFYLWGKFKDGRNTDELSKQALQYGVSFVPGSIYGTQSEYNDSFRIAYAQIDKERIVEAVKRFHKLVQDTM
ncbi:MAG: PLP-dependent aminotransferase family protein [Candidatus Gracilibacteria bacterium]|nr:PLP-dependent aminotransferase family protein [Candidatus Gracilibacteria bacterium]